MKKLCLSLLFVAVIYSCKKNSIAVPVVHPAATITSFSFLAANNPKLNQNVVCTISNDTISAYLPLINNLDSLVANFIVSDSSVVKSITVNSVLQMSGVSMNNYVQTVTYTLLQKDTTISYIVLLHRFTGLPLLYITTSGGASIDSKFAYVAGNVSLDANSTLYNTFNSAMQIKLHGNSTLDFPKLPYKIKLSSKASLLGMPAQKNWVLLANYSDKTLMRTCVAFKESQLFGLPYTPRSQFVEVFLNGVFKGDYQLTEEIEIDPSRVNINEMATSDTTGNNLTGGYLLEFDQKHDTSDVWFSLNSGLPVTMHDPDFNNASQNQYIQNYMQQTEDAINADDFKDPVNGYAKYLNPETLIKWFWVNELMKNNDAQFYSSVYMYKGRNDVLNFGPVWDFDISAGNINYDNNSVTSGWWVKYSSWINRLCYDPAFTQKAIAQWQQVRPSLDSLYGFIDNTAAYLEQSEKQNFSTWPILSIYVWPNSEVAGSYAGEVAFLKNWLRQRIAWIDANIQSLQN